MLPELRRDCARSRISLRRFAALRPLGEADWRRDDLSEEATSRLRRVLARSGSKSGGMGTKRTPGQQVASEQVMARVAVPWQPPMELSAFAHGVTSFRVRRALRKRPFYQI